MSFSFVPRAEHFPYLLTAITLVKTMLVQCKCSFYA